MKPDLRKKIEEIIREDFQESWGRAKQLVEERKDWRSQGDFESELYHIFYSSRFHVTKQVLLLFSEVMEEVIDKKFDSACPDHFRKMHNCLNCTYREGFNCHVREARQRLQRALK